MKLKLMNFTIILLFSCLTINSYAQSTNAIMGRVEKVTLLPEQFVVDAKMDTGAFLSSIQATNIKKFTKGNKQWVSFVLQHHNINKKLIRPYIGESKIKRRTSQANSKLKYESRPIVSMHFCLNHHHFQAPVSLANRHYFKYPLLIGRNLMQKLHIIIDPSKKNTHTSHC